MGVRSDDEFERFCVDAHPRLVAALAHHCGEVHLAEELAHEALIRAGERWEKVRAVDSPIGWTYRVGANLAASTFRRRGAERRAVARASRSRAASHRDPDGGETVAVRAALGALSDRQRQVVVLRFYLDLSAEQAGEVLGLSAGAVRMQSHRALAVMATHLDDAIDVTEEVHDGR